MRLQTILNRVEKHKSFVYGSARFRKDVAGEACLEVRLRARKKARPVCSGCGRRCPTYDHQPESRRFEFVPLWGIVVYLVYRMRRVNCTKRGVKVERVPWCDGKNQLTATCRWYLARRAKRLSWSEVATVFHTSWDSVSRSVEHAVEWGLKHRKLSGVVAVGIDEIAWHKDHKYLTLVYDLSGGVKRLLAVAENRTESSLQECLSSLGEQTCAGICYVCSDMWKPYLNVIETLLGRAVHVLDRFHVMQKFGKALDDIRAEEQKQLKRDGYEPVLKKSRWCLLKRPENLTAQQTVRLSELLKYNLKSVRAYLLREAFKASGTTSVHPGLAGSWMNGQSES